MHKSRRHNNLVGKRQLPSIVRGLRSFMCLQKAAIHTCIQLTAKRAEEFHAPWPGCFFTGGVSLALVLLVRVNEVVGVAIAQGPANDERALPWRG